MQNYLKTQGFTDDVINLIKTALAEDGEDATTLAIFSHQETAKAKMLCKEDSVLACLNESLEVFRYLDSGVKIETYYQDSDKIKKGDIIARVEGKVTDILRGERICLNIIQRACGIAAKTSRFVEIVQSTGSKILDTRKTAPGLRFLDKYSVVCGGGYNHRYGLSDMVMIKDNHIDRAGGISWAVSLVRSSSFHALPIEVECRTLEDVQECIALKVNRIMLDNMSNALMKEAVKLTNKRIELEASGGIDEKTIRAAAETGVDYISVGALTHSVKAADISLKIEK